MFGYIKPYIPDLKVREHELYRALYCGLCRTMGRETGTLSRFTLSYDFAFLSAVRFLATGNLPIADKKSCMAHPLKKRSYIKDSEELRYCARVSALLTDGKLRDDLADEAGLKRLRAILTLPEASYMVKKALKHGDGALSPIKDAIIVESAVAGRIDLASARLKPLLSILLASSIFPPFTLNSASFPTTCLRATSAIMAGSISIPN